MAETRAQSNRKIRQEALRDQLSNQKLVEKVLDNIKKMEELSVSKSDEDNDAGFELTKLKTANEQRLKLINKYLPDLKATEITGDGGDDITVSHIHDIPDELLERIIGNSEAGS